MTAAPERRVLLVGLWRDDGPLGQPQRFAHLPALARAHGLQWVPEHHTQLDADAWIRRPPAGIALSGSGHCLGEDCALGDFPAVLRLLAALPRTPVCGLCFGHQLLNLLDGGELGRFGRYREDDDFAVDLGEHPLFAGLPRPCPLAENHGQRVARAGRGWAVIATSADGIEATAHAHLPRVSFQFHPEYYPRQRVPHGERILSAWLRSL